ncbi:transcription/translation regulatory transformer protein RfaH [bacterium]|nr:transcription/translation regulatory transformer protein RfaH [bacterium]
MLRQGNLSWLLVASKPRSEFVARHHLERQGFEVCLPQITLRKRKQGKWQQVTEPMFPGYVFVGLEMDKKSIAPIRSTRGCSCVVTFGGEVRPLPRTLVGQFQPFNDAPFNGSSDLKVGQKVLIQAGAFEGLEAVFEKPKGADRAQLLITMLGQPRSVEVRMDSIDAC